MTAEVSFRVRIALALIEGRRKRGEYLPLDAALVEADTIVRQLASLEREDVIELAYGDD